MREILQICMVTPPRPEYLLRVSTKLNMEPRTSRFIQPYLTASRGSISIIIAIMIVTQIACCVIVGLHLTGHFQAHGAERRSAMGEAFMEPQQKHQSRIHKRQRNRTPVAHLPIRPQTLNGQREVPATIVHWNADQGHLSLLEYHDGRILFRKPGRYYVYAQTCFRYYNDPEQSLTSHSDSSKPSQRMMPTPSPVQLFQYIFLERPSRGSPLRPTVIMKTGGTQRWRPSGYHMTCQQQGGIVALRAGDGLYVSVSNAWMLDPEAEGSYFGAFRIAE